MRIILRFIRTPGFVTSAICFVTNSLFDHCEMGIEEDGKVVSWIGAHAGTGIQLRPANYCLPTFERRYAIPVSDSGYAAWRTYVFKSIGVRYDYGDILGLLIHARGMTSAHRMICSQFCLNALRTAGINMLNVLPKWAHLVTPETLHLSPVLIGRGL